MKATTTKGNAMPTAMKNKPALERLEEAREHAKLRKQLPQDINNERVAAQARIEEARQGLRSYFASGKQDEGLELKLREAIARKERELEEQSWGERVEGARMAARSADQDVEKFIVDNFEDIVEERKQVSVTARDNLLEAARGLFAAWDAYEGAAAEWQPILKVRADLELPVEDNWQPGMTSAIRQQLGQRNGQRMAAHARVSKPIVGLRVALDWDALTPPIPQLVDPHEEAGK